MERRRVERRNAGNLGGSEEQWQFRPAEDDSVDVIAFSNASNERDDIASRGVPEVAFEKLLDVALMKPETLRLVWSDHRHPVLLEDHGIEGRRHGESRAEQYEPLKAATSGLFGADLD